MVKLAKNMYFTISHGLHTTRSSITMEYNLANLCQQPFIVLGLQLV